MKAANGKDRFAEIWGNESKRQSTENLIFYDSLATKEDLFGVNYTFDSSTEFLSFWDDLPVKMKDIEMVYRGVSQASFRLFNKAQRNYINNKRHFEYEKCNYHDLILKMISNAQMANDKLLTRYFKAFGAPNNDISILSFLQHYGAPTPLLDWTKDIDIALYFATSQLSDQEVEKHYLLPAYDINSYASVYLLNINVLKNYTSAFASLSISGKKTNDYVKIRKKKLAYIEEQYCNNKPQFILENNFNILSQKGVFIYNNSPELPLEEVVYKLSLMYYLVAEGLRGEEDVKRSPLMCLNINKGIIKDIRDALTKKGINKDKIFPRAEDIALGSIPLMLS